MTKNDTILFYGKGCMYCRKLEDYLASHDHPEKIAYVVMKEIYHDDKNREALRQAGKSYGIPEALISIPFLALEGKYLMGCSDIIDYLKEATCA